MPQPTQEIIEGLINVPKREVVAMLEAAYFLMRLQRYHEARDIFQGVAALVPDSDIPLVGLGNVHFAEGKIEQSVKEYEKAIEREPKSALAYAHLGESLLFEKKFDQAVKAIKKAISLEPNGLPAKFAKELLKAKELKIFD
jgi:tetratricopeptide (TPR) repeat protein